MTSTVREMNNDKPGLEKIGRGNIEYRKGNRKQGMLGVKSGWKVKYNIRERKKRKSQTME